jgi:hypothetical protein
MIVLIVIVALLHAFSLMTFFFITRLCRSLLRTSESPYSANLLVNLATNCSFRHDTGVLLLLDVQHHQLTTRWLDSYTCLLTT